MGRLCKAALRRTAAGARVFGALHPSRRDRKQPAHCLRERSGHFPLEGLSRGQQVQGDGAPHSRVHQSLPPPRSAARVPPHSPLRIPGKHLPRRNSTKRDSEQSERKRRCEKQQRCERRSDLVGPSAQRVGVQSQPTCQAPDPLPDATHAVHSVLTAGIDDTAGCLFGGPPKWVIIPAAAAPGPASSSVPLPAIVSEAFAGTGPEAGPG